MTINKLNDTIKSCINKDKNNEKESSEKSEDGNKSENDESVFHRKSTIECKEDSYKSENDQCHYSSCSYDDKYDYDQDEEYSDCISDF